MWKVIVVVATVLIAALTLYLPLSSPVGIFNTPDENANNFFAELFTKRGELRVEEPRSASVDNAIHPRGVNVIGGFLVPESFLGLPVLYGTVGKLTAYAKWCHPEEQSDEGSRTNVRGSHSREILRFAQNDCGVFFITPLLTVAALGCLYGIFSRFFDRSVSRLAWFTGLTLPVLLYWAGRPFMHTLLFLDLLVIGWWLLNTGRPSLRRPGGSASKYRWDLVAGLLLGGALAMRTSELVWVAVGTALLMYVTTVAAGLQPARKLKLAATIVRLVIGVALIFIPLLFLNQDLYGNFFGTGYSVTESNLIREDGEVPQLARTSFAAQLLFPFGFHPIAALGRFVRYALGGMWWYVAPMMLGALTSLFRHSERSPKGEVEESHTVQNGKRMLTGSDGISPLASLGRNDELWRGYIIVWAFVSLYLIFSYGSFNAEIFADPKHPLTATIGSPYLRYWLPIFVFGAPMVAKFLVFLRQLVISSGANRVSEVEKSHTAPGGRRLPWQGVRSLDSLRSLGMTCCVVLLVGLSLRATVWHGPESWHAIRENLLQFSETRERIVRTTSENAVFLIPRWADRIAWPSRRVIVDVEGKDVVAIIKTLGGKDIPVFWLRGRGEIKLEPALSEAGFKLIRRFDVDPKGKIYKITFDK